MTKVELETRIKMANHAYAIGNPYLTDPEYDELWKQLHELDPQNPLLYHTAAGEASAGLVYHRNKILGLQKAFTKADLQIFEQRYGGKQILIQPKYDGVALMLYPQPTGEDMILLSGDGIQGSDVTHLLVNAKRELAPANRHPQSCEAIIKLEDWKPEFGKNPRNVVAGMLNPSRKEVAENSNVITIIEHNRLAEQILLTDATSLQETLLPLYYEWSKIYPMDGLVIKLADPLERTVSQRNHSYYEWSFAWKPPIQTAETTLQDIEWNVSKLGRLIPTIIYDEVKLCGTANNRATGNNAQWIQDRGLFPGAKFILGKAGEIIPQVLEVVQQMNTQKLPENCPKCNNPVTLTGLHLICHSEDCIAKLTSRLDFFYSFSCMDLKGVGNKTISELLAADDIFDILKTDLWALLDPWAYGINYRIVQILGLKRARNYFDNLQRINKARDPAYFLAGLGYDGLGYESAKKLLQHMRNSEIKPLGINPAARESFPKAIREFLHAATKLTWFKFAPLPDDSPITYTITGTFALERKRIRQLLAQHGWVYKPLTTKTTTYCVVGATTHNTKKLQIANLYNIPLLYENDLPITLNSEGDVYAPGHET